MTPREWAAWMEGYSMREEDAWRRTRTLYSIIYNSHVVRHNQLKPEELIPLPGDNTETMHVKVLSDEEREEIKRKLRI